MTTASETPQKCHATSKRTGKQCNKSPMTGLSVCRFHGGATPDAQRKSSLAKAQREMVVQRRFAGPVAEDDWEADPINSFKMEFRRTLGWIRYYEEIIEKQKDDNALMFTMTKLEDKTATEFVGADTTYEAKPHVAIELLYREREHLASLQRTYIRAGLVQQKLDLERDFMDRLELAITAIVSSLGKDPTDPEIRQTIRAELARVG